MDYIQVQDIFVKKDYSTWDNIMQFKLLIQTYMTNCIILFISFLEFSLQAVLHLIVVDDLLDPSLHHGSCSPRKYPNTDT